MPSRKQPSRTKATATRPGPPAKPVSKKSPPAERSASADQERPVFIPTPPLKKQPFLLVVSALLLLVWFGVMVWIALRGG